MRYERSASNDNPRLNFFIIISSDYNHDLDHKAIRRLNVHIWAWLEAAALNQQDG